jgi:hypothetical protein
MRRVLRLLSLAAFALALAATGGCKRACKCEPEIRIVREPQIVEVVRTEYVPIKPELTTQHHIAQGPIAECLVVARDRATELRKCNADKAEIRRVQGTVAPKPAEEHRDD